MVIRLICQYRSYLSSDIVQISDITKSSDDNETWWLLFLGFTAAAHRPIYLVVKSRHVLSGRTSGVGSARGRLPDVVALKSGALSKAVTHTHDCRFFYFVLKLGWTQHTQKLNQTKLKNNRQIEFYPETMLPNQSLQQLIHDNATVFQVC